MKQPFDRISRLLCAVAVCAIVPSGSMFAQSDADANPDPVFVFNRVCYAQVPDVPAINAMATKLAWRALDNIALEEFKPTQDGIKSLEGWDAQVGERLFRVGVSQSKPPQGMVDTFPDFANGTSTSCSIVLDDQQDPNVFMPNMQTLAGKQPISMDVEEGLFLTTTWAGGSDDLKVFLIAKYPKNKRGGLLNVTVLEK